MTNEAVGESDNREVLIDEPYKYEGRSCAPRIDAIRLGIVTMTKHPEYAIARHQTRDDRLSRTRTHAAHEYVQ